MGERIRQRMRGVRWRPMGTFLSLYVVLRTGAAFASGVPFEVPRVYLQPQLGTPLIAPLDYNDDGALDLIRGYGTRLFILLGDGAGHLRRSTELSCEFELSSIATADLNRDGHLDLVLAARNLTFAVGIWTPSGFSFGRYVMGASNLVLTADLNADGWEDILMCGQEVQAFFNQGDGQFVSAAPSQPLNTPVAAAALGDLDGDGDFDLVQSHPAQRGIGWLESLANDGSGHFESEWTQGTTYVPSVTARRMPDGITRVFAVESDSLHVVVLARAAGGALERQAPIDLAISPVLLLDAGADTSPALFAAGRVIESPAATASIPGEVNIDGFFPDQEWFTGTTADMDGDGRLDAVVCGSLGVSVHLQRVPGVFSPCGTAFYEYGDGNDVEVIPVPEGVDLVVGGSQTYTFEYRGGALRNAARLPAVGYLLASGRFDEDDHVDVAGILGSDIVVGWGGARGPVATVTPIPGAKGRSYSSIAAGDIDADGIAEVLATDWQQGVLSKWSWRALEWQRHDVTLEPGSLDEMVTADIDADTHDDVILRYSDRVAILHGAAGLESRTEFAAGSWEKLATGDLNGAAGAEIVLVGGSPPFPVAALQRREDTLELQTIAQYSNGPGPVAIGDLDRDGDGDLVIAVSPGIEVYWNDREQGWRLEQVGAAVGALGLGFKGVVIRDLDGDQWPDLTLLHEWSFAWQFAVTTVRNLGDGTTAIDGGTLTAVADGSAVQLEWDLPRGSAGALRSVTVQRSPHEFGPFESRVRLRDTAVRTFRDPAPGTEPRWYRLEVEEGNGETLVVGPVAARLAAAARAAARLEIHAPRYVATGDGIAFSGTAGAGAAAALAVFDVRGRWLWGTPVQPGARDRFEAVWNVRTSGGAPVPRGVYMVLLRTRTGARTRRVVVR